MNRTKDYGVHHRLLIPFHQIIQIARNTSMPTMTPNAILLAEYLRAVRPRVSRFGTFLF